MEIIIPAVMPSQGCYGDSLGSTHDSTGKLKVLNKDRKQSWKQPFAHHHPEPREPSPNQLTKESPSLVLIGSKKKNLTRPDISGAVCRPSTSPMETSREELPSGCACPRAPQPLRSQSANVYNPSKLPTVPRAHSLYTLRQQRLQSSWSPSS